MISFNFLRVLSLVTFTTIIFLSGCSLPPKATPADADRVMQQAARFDRGASQNLGRSEQYRKPIQSGQWVASLARSKSDPNDVTLQITKVIAVSGNTVTLEMEQYSAINSAKRNVIQQTIRNYPVNARTAYSSNEAADLISNIDVESIKMMDESGQVTNMPQLPFGVGRLGGDLIKSNVATGEIRNEECPNSRFKAANCFVVPFEARMLWVSESGTTYAHSAIPIIGFIRSNSDKHEIEVIGFGDRGAVALIR